MNIPTFDRISFPQMTFNDAKKYALEAHPWVTDEDVKKTFYEWHEVYAKRMYTFYRSLDAYYREFLRVRYPDELDTEYYDEESEMYQRLNEKMVSFSQYCEQQASDANDIYTEYAIFTPEEKEFSFKSVSEIGIKVLKLGLLRLQINGMWEAWFNFVIDNSYYKEEGLKEMDYDEYLKTKHWRLVRYAIMIAYNRKCWQGDCYYFDDPAWADWLQDVHVHHISYKNRGNERYRDLVLMCKRHHKMHHDGALENLYQIVQNKPHVADYTLEEITKLEGDA